MLKELILPATIIPGWVHGRHTTTAKAGLAPRTPATTGAQPQGALQTAAHLSNPEATAHQATRPRNPLLFNTRLLRAAAHHPAPIQEAAVVLHTQAAATAQVADHLPPVAIAEVPRPVHQAAVRPDHPHPHLPPPQAIHHQAAGDSVSTC